MLTVTGNFLGYEKKRKKSIYVATTMYDLVEAVSEQVSPNEEYLLTPAVLKLLRDCRAGYIGNKTE
jgi:hypothetical protein